MMRRTAHTLIELVISMAAATLLMGGLAASLHIASRVFDTRMATVRTAEAAGVQAEIMRDLSRATGFTSRTANAVTFTVPDETGDGTKETVSYAYDAVAGNLTKTFNGNTSTLLSEVTSSAFSFLDRTMAGSATVPTPYNVNDWGTRWGGDSMLLVTAGSSPNSEEAARKAQFESWGFTVTTIEDVSAQAAFDTALASNKVVYVPYGVQKPDIAYKLRNAVIGVVYEAVNAFDYEMGFSSSTGNTAYVESSISIVDNSHGVTSSFSTGTLTVYNSSSWVAEIRTTYAPGMQTLGKRFSNPALAVMNPGATLANNYKGNSTASGKRVRLPFGGSSFVWSNINANGLQLIHNALAWSK